jgi:two-component system response regulator AtoC
MPELQSSRRIAREPDRESSLHHLSRMAARVAPSDINVLILGETGVGKDVWARRIHGLSRRATGPFLAVNCAGLTSSLVESELFGHERGAFTGASQRKPGLLAAAQGGTVFLDEIGELATGLQAKLLRARFIAATNRCLDEEARTGRFRRDLLARLDGMTLTIPPLRERLSEIAPLVHTFVEEAAKRARRAPPAISPEALARLECYDWPGNVRELKSVAERALLFCDGNEIDARVLDAIGIQSGSRLATLVRAARPNSIEPSLDPLVQPWFDQPLPYLASVRAHERTCIVAALAACGGNQTRAAKMLGIPRRTFVSHLDRYGLPRPRKHTDPAGDAGVTPEGAC